MNPSHPGETDLREQFEQMICYHHFGDEEIARATGIALEEVQRLRNQWDLRVERRPERSPDAPLLVLPYPGGRNPRIGAMEEARSPWRETKVSVFTPWDPTSYVVVDVPSRIEAGQELLFQAHSSDHQTVGEREGHPPERRPWRREQDDAWANEWELPRAVRLAVTVTPRRDGVRFELRGMNGGSAVVGPLRIEVCLLLRGATGFEALSNVNKRLQSPWAACRDQEGKRWVLTTWEPTGRCWGNPECPCLHVDPELPVIPPGETRTARGWLSFFQGTDAGPEIDRLSKTHPWGR